MDSFVVEILYLEQRVLTVVTTACVEVWLQQSVLTVVIAAFIDCSYNSMF